jgi:molybdate/tungstate transport system substrate-binding protein
VLYAGSLVNVMEKTVGPAFASATGYTYQGRGAGASQLANQVKAKTVRGDVFISAAPGPDKSLEGSANGGWVSWYATIGTSALVLAYNPNSRFAADLKTKPWSQVLTEPGIRVGRTDPKLDPKGQLTVAALDEAAKNANDPSLAATVESSAQVFPEEELVGRLESGQLDAGFFYTLEATATNLPTVGLNLPGAKATYTVTMLNNGPDAAGGVAFVKYLLGAQGRDQLTAAGMSLTPRPSLNGPSSAVPADLRELVGG